MSRKNEEEEFIERKPFEGVMGMSSNVRLIDFLMAHPFDSYSIKELSEFSGVSRTKIYDILPLLLRFGILKKVRDIGSITMYQTDLSSDVTKAIIKLNSSILDVVVDEELEENEEAYPAPMPYMPPIPKELFVYKDQKRSDKRIYEDLITV